MARLMPGEVRSGLAEAAIQSVERDIPESEVLAAIEGMIGAVPVCMAAPGLWLSDTERSGQFSVRYDLMARDWGRDSAAQARARMDEFVDLGFLSETVTEQGAVSYAVTEAGRPLLRGAFGAGSPPSFCAPAERRVVEIVEMEWGAFDCGSLRVQFSHTNDDWPSWATTAFAQQAVAQSFPAPGEIAYGGVSLSRYWVSRPAAGQPNGALRSMCYDAARQRLANCDLTLDRQGAAVEIVEDAAVDAVDAAAVEAVSVEAVGAAEVEAAEAEQAVTN